MLDTFKMMRHNYLHLKYYLFFHNLQILFQVNETTTGVTYGDVGLDNFQVTNGDCDTLGM